MNNDKGAKSGTSADVAGSPAGKSSKTAYGRVDQLMELAGDKRASAPPARVESDDSGDGGSREKSMWKILLQLKPYLPYLARMVPVLDVALGPVQNAGLSNEVRQGMAESAAKIQTIQRDVTAAVQEQSLQLTRLEEGLARLSQISEKQAAAQASLAASVDSLGKLVRLSAIGLGILLIALIVMTAVLLARLPH